MAPEARRVDEVAWSLAAELKSHAVVADLGELRFGLDQAASSRRRALMTHARNLQHQAGRVHARFLPLEVRANLKLLARSLMAAFGCVHRGRRFCREGRLYNVERWIPRAT